MTTMRSMFVCAVVFAMGAGCNGSTEPADGGDVVANDVPQPMDTPRVDTGVDVVQAAPNAMCATPTTVTPGTPVTGEDPTRGGGGLASRCLTNAVGRVLYYQTNVPAGQTILVTATPTARMDPVIRFLDSCSGSGCLGGFDRQPPGVVEEGHWANTGSAAADVLFSVGAFATNQTGTFDVSATLVPTPHSSTCATADLVTSGMMRMDDLRLADPAEAICVTQSVGFAMFYRVSVPASEQLSVTVTPTGTWNPVVRIMDSCTATACLTMGDTATGGMPETLTYRNSGTAAADVFVAVSPEREADVGMFSVSFTVAP